MSEPAHIDETAVQAALISKLTSPKLGWQLVPAPAVPRALDDVMAEDWVTEGLVKLNPAIQERPERAQEVLTRLRAVLLSAPNDGVLAANEEMIAWLCGRKTLRFVGTKDFLPVNLVDFEHLGQNRLVVSTEVKYEPGNEKRRYDLVLWLNGFPVVVGETKTPISLNTSWLNGANDIHTSYEVKTPDFFVPISCPLPLKVKTSGTGLSTSRPRPGCRGHVQPSPCPSPACHRFSTPPNSCSTRHCF